MIDEKSKDNITKNFIWWMGIVEDRQDPLMIGRCKIRIYGYHTEDLSLLPTNKLPWAHPIYPNNLNHTYAPKEGDLVFGFFSDGELNQAPIFLGTIPNIPVNPATTSSGFNDLRTTQQLQSAPVKPKEQKTNYPRNLDEPTTSRLARNENIQNTIVQYKKDNITAPYEPQPAYNAKYPYNFVHESESGHVIEIDDTPGSERLHEYHRSGTYKEINSSGTKVEKIVKDKYSIILGNDFIHIKGSGTVLIEGNQDVTIRGNQNIVVNGDATIKIDGDLSATVGGSATVDVGGDVSMDVGGRYDISCGGDFTVSAPRIKLN